MRTPLLFLGAMLFISSCSPKQDEKADPAASRPAASEAAPQRDISNATLIAIDEDIQKYTDDVEAAKSAYDAAPNDGNKKKLIAAYVAFGDYMQYDSSVSPREGKYHRALVEYRHALVLDPGNQKITGEIAQIEDIYRSMGRPIPGDE
jgi:tetratricopeptide (TPR) repeat protein